MNNTTMLLPGDKVTVRPCWQYRSELVGIPFGEVLTVTSVEVGHAGYLVTLDGFERSTYGSDWFDLYAAASRVNLGPR